MAEEKSILPKIINPGYNIVQGRGGQGMVMDNNGNTFLFGSNKSGSKSTNIDLNEATSAIFIQSGQPDNIVKTNFSYSSKNFNTVNNQPENIGTKKVIQPQRKQTTTASFEAASEIIAQTSSRITSETDEREIILANQSKISLDSQSLFLPAVEPVLLNIYDEDIEGIPIDVYIGLPPEEKITLTKTSATTATVTRYTGTKAIDSSGNIITSYYPPPDKDGLTITGPYQSLKDQKLPYSEFIIVLSSAIPAVEGWNKGPILGCQRKNNNPGNVRGRGDKGRGTCDSGGNPYYAKFSTLEKGWEALIKRTIFGYINGTTTALNNAGATEYIDIFKETDNQYFEKYGIGYKKLDSYAYKGGPSTFRQFFHQYAPWGDGRNSPVQYVSNVIFILKREGINIKSVDDLIKNYI